MPLSAQGPDDQTAGIGIDVGTQGARCVIAAEGRLVEAAEPFRLASVRLPEGWLEQPPEAWLQAVSAAVRGAVRQWAAGGGRTDQFGALSVTSTSGTLCALDADGRPLAPAIMYNDRRSEREAERVQEAGAPLAGRLGYGFSASFGLPKLLWLQRERPDVYARAAHFGSPTDFIIGWLTGVHGVSDPTNMLKFGYDLLEQRWPSFLAEGLGLDAERLPRVVASGKPVGRLRPERAEELGLEGGLTVVAGLTDGCASQISSGAVDPGQYNTTLGTTMVIKGVSRALLLDPLGRIYCHRHPEGWWLPGGASNTGAGCLAAEFTEEETERLSAGALALSPTSCVAYPLVGRGERFPFRAPHARAFTLGEPASRAERFVAYLEGVACLERLAYEVLESLGAQIGDEVRSAGGGSRSAAWLQIRADVLGRAVSRPSAPGAAMGAAVLAAAHARRDGLAEAARALVSTDLTVVPRADRLAAYADAYGRFRDECVRRGYLESRAP